VLSQRIVPSTHAARARAVPVGHDIVVFQDSALAWDLNAKQLPILKCRIAFASAAGDHSESLWDCKRQCEESRCQAAKVVKELLLRIRSDDLTIGFNIHVFNEADRSAVVRQYCEDGAVYDWPWRWQRVIRPIANLLFGFVKGIVSRAAL
jgi:hypothetical protein